MIKGKIYKYDLVTSLLVFQFEALEKADDMILYEDDDKLCIYNKDEIQLWDLDEDGEQQPYLFEDEFFDVKTKEGFRKDLDCVYINENCENDRENRMWLLDFNAIFRIYKGSRFENEYIEVNFEGESV